jgi:hypothetical protein
LLRRATVQTMERSLQRIGVAVSQRALGRSISRWVPLAGAVGVGAYAFYDTIQVGRTAMELFESDVVTQDTAGAEPARPGDVAAQTGGAASARPGTSI